MITLKKLLPKSCPRDDFSNLVFKNFVALRNGNIWIGSTQCKILTQICILSSSHHKELYAIILMKNYSVEKNIKRNMTAGFNV